jgi:calcineurin-like phosphoesterase family protein
MRLFVTGDVHRTYNYGKLKLFQERMGDVLTLDDCLVVCGDFGAVWHGKIQDKIFMEEAYENFPCKIAFVDGNHENFDELETYPVETWNGGRMRRIANNVLHLMRGEVFTLPVSGTDTKIFTFGGAMSTDRGYKTGYTRYWWPRELPNQEEINNAWKNLAAHNNAVEYIITHDGPRCALCEMIYPLRQTEATFSGFLSRIAEEIRFKTWFFGHHHLDKRVGDFYCIYDDIVELRPYKEVIV